MHALNRLATASPLAKTSLIVGGYAVAFGLAVAVVGIHVAATSGPDWNAYSGMLAFGDTLLFLAVFGLAALPPTSAALFCLRPYPSIWRFGAFAALGIAASGIAALIAYVASRNGSTGGFVDAWSALSPIRILPAPLLAGAYLLSAVFAPVRWCRTALIGATLTELVVFSLYFTFMSGAP